MKWIQIPVDELLRRWNSGERLSDIAKDAKVSRSHLTEYIVPYLRDKGALFKERSRRASSVERCLSIPIEILVHRWNSKELVSDLAEDIGVSRSHLVRTIIPELRKRGMILRNRKKREEQGRKTAAPPPDGHEERIKEMQKRAALRLPLQE